jgi:threonylcarbamoyladenosine tRNA methylthiotransferase MtaB
MIRRMQRRNPTARLVVSGCYTALDGERTAADLGVDLVVGNADKDHLVELTRAALSLPAPPAAALAEDAEALFARGRSRAFIKVQDGCRYRCTFCIVTVARGAERSRTVAEIISEINMLHHQGVQEAILTGVHLGGYGSDIASDLYALISAVLHETDIPRLRLGSLEPWDLPEHFFGLFENPRLLPHLHLPLQSGNDHILRRMARRCKTADFTRLVEQARAQIADFNLTTDVIAGFPGESEADWQQTIDYIAATGFGHLHIFPYSPRSGTRAAQMPEQLDRAVKRQRVAELHELAGTMKKQTMERYLNRTFPILWESKTTFRGAERFRYWGYTPNYLRVAVDVPAAQALAHSIRTARLRTIDTAGEVVISELAEDAREHPCSRQ